MLEASWEDATQPSDMYIQIKGRPDLFVRTEAILSVKLPIRVEGTFSLVLGQSEERDVYFVGREWAGE